MVVKTGQSTRMITVCGCTNCCMYVMGIGFVLQVLVNQVVQVMTLQVVVVVCNLLVVETQVDGEDTILVSFISFDLVSTLYSQCRLVSLLLHQVVG